MLPREDTSTCTKQIYWNARQDKRKHKNWKKKEEERGVTNRIGICIVHKTYKSFVYRTCRQCWSVGNHECIPLVKINFVNSNFLLFCRACLVRSHRFNAKICFEKYALSPKILPKNCPKSAFQTKPAKFDTFWPISRDLVHIFQNRFLCWNYEIELVNLNTMNPMIRKIFFHL